MRVRRFVRDAVRTKGTLIDYTEGTEKRTVSDSSRESGMATETVAVYRLRIKFTTAEGAIIDFFSRFKTDKRPQPRPRSRAGPSNGIP